MRFSALGDIAMSVPEAFDVAASNPDTQFVFLTRSHPAQLFTGAPANLTVVGVDLDRYRGLRGLHRLYRRLRDEFAVTTVIDLHDVLRTRILRLFFRLGGATVRHIDKSRRARRRLTRRHNKVMLPLSPVPERYHDVFSRAGIYSRPQFTTIFPAGRGPAAAFARVAAPKKPGERWLAVAPFARHAGKIYPIELMEKVIAHFAARGVKVFLFGGGPDETAALRGIASRCPGAVCVAGQKLGLHAELALLSWCDAALSMDSSNMHLAALAGIPAVTVWGATHPYAGFMPRRLDPALAVQLDMVCRPCSVFGNKPCFRGDYNCLRGIPPALIISTLEPLLQPANISQTNKHT